MRSASLPAALTGSFAASLALVLALALGNPAVQALVVPPGAPDLAPLATFRVVDSGAHGPELNIGVAPSGSVFVGGWDHIARSRDDGASWEAMDIPAAPGLSVGFAADRVLIVDHDTGRLIEDDTTLGCTIISWSDDEGESWTRNPLACGGGVTDHQKVAVGKRTALQDPTGLLYPNIMYACANGLSHANCGVSADGGLTFLPAAPHGILCAFQGAPIADREGTLYEPTSSCGAMVRKTVNNGMAWSEHDVTVAEPSNDTPDLGITSDGTLYYFYTDEDWKPALARSTDGGLTWQGPFAVPVPGLRSSLFPSIVGGDSGHIALSFYGTTDDDTNWDGNPGEAPDAIRWHGYVAVITDADAAAPSIAPVQITPPGDPLQYGCLSKLGGGCLGNIADYMDIDVGTDGRVYAVFTDGCLPGCDSKAESDSDNAIVAIQQAGATLFLPRAEGPLDEPAPAPAQALVRDERARRLLELVQL